jgi:hypothetical protein
MAILDIQTDRENLTIMGVPFPDLETLENVAHGIMTNAYEGFVPKKRDVEIIRDCSLGKISFEEMIRLNKEQSSGL